MYKHELSDGSACILVKFEDSEGCKRLLDYLHKNDFKATLKGPMGMEQYSCNWYWINMNSHVYCIGKPGVAYTKPLGKHAITPEEFITIHNIYKKYEGLSVLKMS